jgi:hypothetical protein
MEYQRRGKNDDMTTRQLLITAIVIGTVCAVIVWWLEGFERKRLVCDWQSFIDNWSPPSVAGEGAA